MTAVLPFIPHPSQPTSVDLCNGFTYRFEPPSSASSIPPARLAVFDPQLLWDRLRGPIEQLFPLSSVVLRGKTGQVTISNVDVQVVFVHSSPVQSVTSTAAASLRSAVSWHHLPYVHLYLLATASYTAYVKHHRLLIAPFVAAFTDSSAAAASTASSSASTSSPTAASTSLSTSPSSAHPTGSDVLIVYCMHADERRDSKNERKMLDKLRSDWGKDAVVPIVLSDEWWSGWGGEGGGLSASAAGGAINNNSGGGEEGVMSSISISSLFPSASSSPPPASTAGPPPLSTSLLPSLRARFTSSFSVRCDSLHSLVHSLLLLSAYPHWPFTRFLLIQLTACRVHCQFGLFVEALRLLDEGAAVMAGSNVQQLIGEAATRNKVRLRYLYDEGTDGADEAQRADAEEAELFHNRLSLLQCERLLYAQQAAVLRRMGRIEEVVERGEAVILRWMDREGWEVWGWLVGCVVDVWSRAEREVRERHADERRSKGGGGAEDDGRRNDKSGEEVKAEKQKRHRLSTSAIRPRSLTPERPRRPPQSNAHSTTTAATATATTGAATVDDKHQQQQPTASNEGNSGVTAASAPPPSAPAASKAKPHKRSHATRHLSVANVSVRGNHALTAQLRQLHAQRVSGMFACINRLMEERKRVEREKGRFDVMDEEGRAQPRRWRERVRDDREERDRRLAEWRDREGDEYMLVLDDEVTAGEAVYEQRQRKVEFAMHHSCLFPLLLHALLYFTSPSAAHSYHYISLYCHALSALSLPSFASSLHLYLSSVYCWQHWIGLARRQMEWRLREERDARRWAGVAHSVLMLLGMCGGRWIDVRVREMSDDVGVPTERQEALQADTDQSHWLCCDQPKSEALQSSDATSLLALFRHICHHHLPPLSPSASQYPSTPDYHRCRALGSGQALIEPTLPLPRPSIPSPAALPSIIVSSRASHPPSNAPLAFIASLNALLPIQALTLTIQPRLTPVHLCLRLTFDGSSSASPLSSVVLDDFAFTVSLQRRGERIDIDCEYRQQVQLTGEEVWLHAVLSEEGGKTADCQVDAADSHHMCALRLSSEDYSALQSLLAVSAADDSPLLVSLSDVWLRYQRLHLLPFNRQAIDTALTVSVDHATSLAASTLADSSACRFLQPFIVRSGVFSLSPRASLTSAPLALTLLPSSHPGLLDSTATVRFALQTTAPLPFCRLTLSHLGSGGADGGDRCGDSELVGEMVVLVSQAGAVGYGERSVRVVNSVALLGPLLAACTCVLECRIRSPTSHSVGVLVDGAVETLMTATLSVDSAAVVELPFAVSFVAPFSASCSLLHFGHRVFVCATIRCCQLSSVYELDSVSVEWAERWTVLSRAGETEMVGIALEGGAEVRVMFELEREKMSESSDTDSDATVSINARVSCVSQAESAASVPVISRLPLRLLPASLTPPLLHLILSSPPSASVGQPITVSLTLLLSLSLPSAPSASSVLRLLCCLEPSDEFYVAGHTAFTVSLSSTEPSHSHSVVMVPLQSGARRLPAIKLKEKRPSDSVASASECDNADDEWMDVPDGRMQCHFGVEHVRVLSSGAVRCELERHTELSHDRLVDSAAASLPDVVQ